MTKNSWLFEISTRRTVLSTTMSRWFWIQYKEFKMHTHTHTHTHSNLGHFCFPSPLGFSLKTHSMNTSVACAVDPSITTSLTDFSFQNLGINSIKSCSSRSFPTTPKGTFQFLQNFQLRFNLIFSEEIIQYSRTFALQVQKSWNQAHAPILLRAFQRHQEHDLKHPGILVQWIS